MNLEDLESFNFESAEHELESYNEFFETFDIYSLDKNCLEKYIKILNTHEC